MATVLLAAAGAAAGSAMGGSVLGLSAAALGRAAGATLGKVIDQKILGTGSEPVDVGKIERFRLTGASEGRAIGRVWGRVRVGGQVIWATRFRESVSVSGGGKGTSSQPKTREYSYSVSLAIALSEGEVTRVGRIWADGVEITRDSLEMRVYSGTKDQLPDPRIEAVEGAGNAPAYRGIAYVVLEDIDLGRFGNRVPQFSFEVERAAQPVDLPADVSSKPVSKLIKAVSLVPGTGEYSLATTPVHYDFGLGATQSANINSPSGKTDFATSLEQMGEEMPDCESVSIIVSWFGDDLRAGSCQLQPKVDRSDFDGVGMPWRVSGIDRASAQVVPQVDGRALYGGTPADASVIEAIAALQGSGKRVMFYPFILMEQRAGNGLADPYGAGEQPALPWRGRITADVAPGLPGDPDGTADVDAQVAAFFGVAQTGDFTNSNGQITYTGPAEKSYRRFILHYAHLCAAAGGVDAFCIGSEMRGLTTLRGLEGYPAVAALQSLAADVRAILGPECKIGYAADWSEYFGHQPADGSGDVTFHLDPLWADANIDFIGIDNYMPLSDWREGSDHLDADQGSIYALDYLKANIAGGEGYDWYYASAADRDAQQRTPITDGLGEAWVYRYKDLLNWWSNPHHDRPGGIRAATPTEWVPQSKPIWFTELGCAAIDKGTNQPNKFLDPKSSESALPHYSSGARDDLIQAQYLRAMTEYWSDAGNNPVSTIYGAPMVDMRNAHVWAWDARPFPHFPMASDLWSDSANYSTGHWLNGRVTNESLSSVVAEICRTSGMASFDVSGLYGLVRGYEVAELSSARAALQPLMLAYGFEAAERDGVVRFRMRRGQQARQLQRTDLALSAELEGEASQTRSAEAETAGRVRLNYVAAERDYETRSAEAIFPDETSAIVSQSELPVALTREEASAIVERWLSEARVARESAKFALPPSMSDIGAGDVVVLPEELGGAHYRIDGVELLGPRVIEAVRVEDQVYASAPAASEIADQPVAFVAPTPVLHQFLDLPLLTGDEVPHAPHIAISATPWPGPVTVQGSSVDAGYDEDARVETPSVIGQTLNGLAAAQAGTWDLGPALMVEVRGGALFSADRLSVLNGANAVAIGDGSADNWEIFQFAKAELVGEHTYALSERLRGQRGTDAAMPSIWPPGSRIVLLGSGMPQLDLQADTRGLERHYRIGPANLALDNAAFQHVTESFEGIGLRPYAPVHLKAIEEGGDLQVRWVRRTRINGDSWLGTDVPLGEDREAYVVRVVSDGTILREETVTQQSWTYTNAARAADAPSLPFEIHVAQSSERFGAGLFRRIQIDV